MLPAQSTPTFQMNVIMGKLVGVCQDDRFFYARIALENSDYETRIPISIEQFHKLKLDKTVKVEVSFDI